MMVQISITCDDNTNGMGAGIVKFYRVLFGIL